MLSGMSGRTSPPDLADENRSDRGRMHRVVLYVSHHGCPNTDLTKRYPDVRVDSISGAYTQDNRKKQLLKIESETSSLGEFVEAYRDHARVVEAKLYPHENTDSVAHISTVIEYDDLRSVSDILSSQGVYCGSSATALGGSERWRTYFECHGDIGSVVEALESAGNDVRIEAKQAIQIESHQTPRSSLDGLTPRQREVFLTAMEQEYFAMNSDADLESLAEALDLSTSAVWEHLSRAKHKILSSVASDLVE